ncbi:MAG: HAMP domain-containing histidine kinase [Brevinematales bacterium]|nr:HAMP domain-containing histidine kinase [Brevinematales bacterium]
MSNDSFYSKLVDILSLETRLGSVFQDLYSLLESEWGVKEFVFGDFENTVFVGSQDIYSKFVEYVRNLRNYEVGKEFCCFKFVDRYFMCFDIPSTVEKGNIVVLYHFVDNYLRNYVKFEGIYNRFKYLKSLVFAIEPLIYEVSIKSAFSQSLLSLVTFTDIEKSLVGILSGNVINVISSFGEDINFIKSTNMLEHVKNLIKHKKEEFFYMENGNENSSRLVGILPLGEFGDIKGIFAVWFNKNKNSITDIDKEILKVLSFVMTHRIKLHEINTSLIKAKRRAEELSRLKSEFVANVSHELRTPLNAILGFVELLKIGSFSEEEQKKYLDYILSAGTSLLSMINNILDLSKLEAGAMTPVFTDVNLSELLDDVKKYGEVLAMNKGISLFVYNLIGEVYIKTDYMMIKSILTNLVSNAIKFTEKGWVKVYLYKVRESIVFKVEDTGIGISEDDIERIFDTFTQLEEVRVKRFQGTGIGLSLSKKFASMIGGQIIPKTKGIGKGSIFYLVIKSTNLNQNNVKVSY